MIIQDRNSFKSLSFLRHIYINVKLVIPYGSETHREINFVFFCN